MGAPLLCRPAALRARGEPRGLACRFPFPASRLVPIVFPCCYIWTAWKQAGASRPVWVARTSETKSRELLPLPPHGATSDALGQLLAGLVVKKALSLRMPEASLAILAALFCWRDSAALALAAVFGSI